ncbi:hypothetical protein BN2476_380016 [Paraburkholderia piptadeniae]|uniref:Uncharacterized protein n=1 Tax=Paraburkholderia piptadeniae TaxID=1701573 RepID=A0A1N7S9P9_9BURK|nr:hypothetical protein BN2476_380016 [Paraburkholderia piptadeniae]
MPARGVANDAQAMVQRVAPACGFLGVDTDFRADYGVTHTLASSRSATRRERPAPTASLFQICSVF